MANRYAEWETYEPHSIRKNLPLEWAVGYLFDAWGAGAAMMPCPLPGHDDSTPSFNLWAENADGFPIRYGCFGCTANGDVVDLIRLARGVGFLEACRIAVEELIPEMERSNWHPADRPAGPVRAAKTHDELQDVLNRIDAGFTGLDMFVARKYGGRFDTMHDMGRFADYAAMSWDWQALLSPAPTLLFPHRDWERRLTGIRYRSVRRDSTRWTELGSRFPALYGAWRDRGQQSVLLCEGETDTVWAGWQIDGDSRPFDVLGLPSGAAQKPNEGAVRRLAMRHVYLAFDSDMAGRIATARWLEALGGTTYRTAVVPIPEGEDLLSCGIPVADLITEVE